MTLRPRSYKVGDILEVKIEKIVPRGFGLAFAEALTVFVRLSVPGDLLRVQIREIKKGLAFAEIVEVIEPGPERIQPPCPYFGPCGGCDFQQLSYAAQLDAKVGIIRDCLHRIGKIDIDDIAIIASPEQLAYRSRGRWHLDPKKKAFGYFARDSHEVVDIAMCPKLTPELESAFENIRAETEWEMLWDRSEIEAAAGEEGEVSVLSHESNELAAALSFTVDNDEYRYSAETFFQANKFLIGKLIDVAIGGAGGQTAFDLYCGVGLFTLPLARRFGSVVGVEGNPVATKFAKQNIFGVGLSNTTVATKSVAEFLGENTMSRIDFVLIDPPRAGTEKGVIASVASLRPAEISYVSCEPSILARDMRILIDAGYAVKEITALDMFPQTHHVETVVRLIHGQARK